MVGEELYVESEYSETVPKPLDIYDDFELIDKYRSDRQSIMMICDMLQDDLESSTFRNQAYFFFMFYLHDISIQSLKLVSYIKLLNVKSSK